MTQPEDPSLFEQLGGEAKLRAIVSDFVDHVFDDVMIGFFFAKADRARIKEKEYEFAAAHLGGHVAYTGRTLPAAHGPHPITGGHFMRRLQILRETLERHGAPSAVITHWLAHNEKLRSAITKQQGSECRDGDEPNQKRLPLAFGAMAPAPEGVKAPAKRKELPLAGRSGKGQP